VEALRRLADRFFVTWVEAISGMGRGAWHPLADGKPPRWASSWGEDRRGVWAGFSISGVTQRMRWIRSGRFVMGSPETEAGRFDNEGPQHEVTIGRGFWLGDTPCTQALWHAVMGDNPSRFQTAERPVEQVSFEEMQTFFQRAGERVPKFGLRLPSEAEWEYACRAGTLTATYAGDLEILGDANAPVLDPIAIYSGNSGVGFELEDGEDLSKFLSNFQYPKSKSGTHPVGKKLPNPWGLQDMLGNVYEWCADTWHENYNDAPADGRPWVNDQSAKRVVRGGSWSSYARNARAAIRIAYDPGDRFKNLGFRCAGDQEGS